MKMTITLTEILICLVVRWKISVAKANSGSVRSNTENMFLSKLKRNMKVPFKLNDSDKRYSVELISRAAKTTRKFSKASNSQFADRSVR